MKKLLRHKTYVLWLKVYYPRIILSEIEKYFRDHKTKLNQAQELLIILDFERYNPDIGKQLIQAQNKSKQEIYNLSKEKFEVFTNSLEYRKTQKQLDWWKKAKDLKEKGLYVNKNNNPNEITKEIYEEANDTILRVFIPILTAIDEMYKNKKYRELLLEKQEKLIQLFQGK